MSTALRAAADRLAPSDTPMHRCGHAAGDADRLAPSDTPMHRCGHAAGDALAVTYLLVAQRENR